MTFLICFAWVVGSVPAATGDGALGLTDPLWEMGLFVGGARLPAYRGSGESRDYVLPLPYGIYRGDVVNLDRESITGLFFKSDRLEVDTSIFLDVNDNDDARRGMPELAPIILAIGPAMKIYFRRIETAGYDLYLDLPLRAAVSADTGDGLALEYRGMHVKVNLFYENRKMFRSPRCELTAALGIAFFDSDLSAYYYDVDGQYVLDGRPEFASGAGYAGASGSVNLLYRVTRRVAIRAYGRVDSLYGAVFEDSPLVAEPTTVAVGLAMMFNLRESGDRVPRR